MKQILASIILIVIISFNSNSQSIKPTLSDSTILCSYIGGKPNIYYQRGRKKVLNSMGIGSETLFGDCIGIYDYKYDEFQKKNPPDIEFLKSQLGNDLKTELNRLAKAKMN